mmetsp:Transcript_85916/g.184126  ORF Transcript_85916/g.184126 Transcript_85916/m.184126 type:complete len:204 (+) Transcript_85916:197-808(+)
MSLQGSGPSPHLLPRLPPSGAATMRLPTLNPPLRLPLWPDLMSVTLPRRSLLSPLLLLPPEFRLESRVPMAPLLMPPQSSDLLLMLSMLCMLPIHPPLGIAVTEALTPTHLWLPRRPPPWAAVMLAMPSQGPVRPPPLPLPQPSSGTAAARAPQTLPLCPQRDRPSSSMMIATSAPGHPLSSCLRKKPPACTLSVREPTSTLP